MLPTKLWFIRPSGFRGEDFFKSANQKQELPVVAMFVNGSGFIHKKFHPQDYELLAHLAKGNVSFYHNLAYVVC
jgi:hypothetical protein